MDDKKYSIKKKTYEIQSKGIGSFSRNDSAEEHYINDDETLDQ